MADHRFDDANAPRRRRGPPPRLYVLLPTPRVPWLRVRRLGEPDRAALLAHLGRLAAAAPPGDRPAVDAAGIAALCAGLDFGRVVVQGAFAGNAVIAAACGLPGLEIVATEEPVYRGRDLGAMLAAQVVEAGPGRIAMTLCPGDSEPALLRLLRSLGTGAEQAAAAAPDLAQIA
ncbi:hypothetical protein E2C06_04155 [Dankookia rubra]|uniref:GNAT family N-acetyltransferase n=1 Tax=Dankookia rubra TaxID=1442381 RepID=A0A4R5QMA4_9PROT|nr:hypothetical protein [Dankookia rubra]TDH64019.1 hypothetical protein E2C06_04155 [Dankookia rubra]